MVVVHSPDRARELVREARRGGATVAFVPTMGSLHDGHLSLMRAARTGGAYVVVSLFVNPTQFGPGEDFEHYPRDFARDRDLAAAEGVAMLFAPGVDDLYPEGHRTLVEVAELGAVLCGASRPTHFRGVTTVVAKLLNIVEPDLLFLGRKDAQQAVIIERMVRDLHVPCGVVVCPTVREADGLAMSSRNAYLSPEERVQARSLSVALHAACDAAVRGERCVAELTSLVRNELGRQPLLQVEYVEAVDARTLEPLVRLEGSVLLAVAVRAGRARLIDNALMTVGPEEVTVEL